MSTLTKRPATEQEEADAIKVYDAFNGDNTERLREAKAEGYSTEVCTCGSILPAFVHFVRCQEDGCPFHSKTDKRSVLERLLGLDEEHTE